MDLKLYPHLLLYFLNLLIIYTFFYLILLVKAFFFIIKISKLYLFNLLPHFILFILSNFHILEVKSLVFFMNNHINFCLVNLVLCQSYYLFEPMKLYFFYN